MFTLGDLLPAPDLGDLLLEQLVALAADVGDLLAGDAEVLDGSEDLLGNLGRGLVLGQGIRVVERVICKVQSVRGPDRPSGRLEAIEHRRSNNRAWQKVRRSRS